MHGRTNSSKQTLEFPGDQWKINQASGFRTHRQDLKSQGTLTENIKTGSNVTTP